jgi:hypothetical protein
MKCLIQKVGEDFLFCGKRKPSDIKMQIKPVNAIQLSNFSIEDLFFTKTVEPSKTVTDAVQSYHIGTILTHGNNNNKKRGLSIDKHDNMTE